MRIAVNARFLLKDRLEGLGRFSDEVLKRITRSHPEHEFIFFFDRDYDPSFIYAPNVIPVKVFPPARHPFLYYIWFEWRLPALFRKWKVDAFLSPDGFLSLSSSVPQVPVIHDLAFEHYPGYVSKTGAAYYKKYFPRFAKKALRIATVSEFSKKDIQDCYGIPAEKIDVVYNGASPVFKEMDPEKIKAFRESRFEGKPWFVYVGSLHPRKNIGRLLQAFDAFKRQDKLQYQMVIIGRKAWQTREMEAVFESLAHKNEVHFTGRISDEELLPYLCGARALTYIPVFEGFGLPLLEGFCCALPAITSNVSSLPEVAGEAAICIDPLSINAIAGAMSRMSTDDPLYMDLQNKARQRALDFSWDLTANKLWQCLEKGIFDRA